MSEVVLCQECRERINLDAEEYVVPNRATASNKWQLVYAHARCVEGHGSLSKMSDMELEQRHQELLKEAVYRMDDEALRRLGLQRIEGEPR